MSAVNDFSKKVALKYSDCLGDKEAAFDPSIILVIAEMVVELVKVLQDYCAKTSDGIVQTLQKPRLVDRLAVRMRIRRKLSENGGLRILKKVNELTDSFFDAGKDLTVEEVEVLYGEVSE